MDIDEIRVMRDVLKQTIATLVGEFSVQTDCVIRVRVDPVFIDTTNVGDPEPMKTFLRYKVDIEGEL